MYLESTLITIAAIDYLVKQLKEGIDKLTELSDEEKIFVWNQALDKYGLAAFKAGQPIQQIATDPELKRMRESFLIDVLKAEGCIVTEIKAVEALSVGAMIKAVWHGNLVQVDMTFYENRLAVVSTSENGNQPYQGTWDKVLTKSLELIQGFKKNDDLFSAPPSYKKALMVGRLQEWGFAVDEGMLTEDLDKILIQATWKSDWSREDVELIKADFFADNYAEVWSNDFLVHEGNWKDVSEVAKALMEEVKAKASEPAKPKSDIEQISDWLQEQGFVIQNLSDDEKMLNMTALKADWTNEQNGDRISVDCFWDMYEANIYWNGQLKVSCGWNNMFKHILDLVAATKIAEPIDPTDATSIMTAKLLEQGFVIKERNRAEQTAYPIGLMASWTNEHNSDKISVELYADRDYGRVHLNHQMKAALTWDQVYETAINLIAVSKAEISGKTFEEVLATKPKSYVDRAKLLIYNLQIYGSSVSIHESGRAKGLIIKACWKFTQYRPEVYMEFYEMGSSETGTASAQFGPNTKMITGTWDSIFADVKKYAMPEFIQEQAKNFMLKHHIPGMLG